VAAPDNHRLIACPSFEALPAARCPDLPRVLNGKRRAMISHKRGGSGTDMKIEIEISDVLQFRLVVLQLLNASVAA
jgi:hypothetical protein